MPTTLITRLSDTGVAAGSYNRVTVDSKGRVLTGSNMRYDDGEVQGSSSGSSVTLNLLATGVNAGEYGGSTQIPRFTVDSKGRITSATEITVYTDFVILGDTGQTTYNIDNTLSVLSSGSNIITSVSSNTIRIGLSPTVSIASLIANNISGSVTGSLVSDNATLTGGSVNNVSVGDISPSTGKFTSLEDQKGDVRSIPVNIQGSAYTLTSSDHGKCVVISTGNILIPNNVFSSGNVVTIFNNSSNSRTISVNTGVNLILATVGTTGNRTMSEYSMATLLFIGGNTAVISGSGIS
jgi:hypothetical protein